jgi:DNA polymerase (family X)
MKMGKDMVNGEIAELLRAIAISYQLKNPEKNKFRIIAYERAADAVEHLSSEAKDVWDEGKLKDIPGVGESIAANLDEIFRTGKSKHFAEVMKDFPPILFTLTELPKIGAKTAFKLVKNLHVKSIDDLEKLAKKGEIAKLEGFGEESQNEIIKVISQFKNKKADRYLLPYAESIANELITYLKKKSFVLKADPLGSLRRKDATVGDIDISVASNDVKAVLDYFTSYPKAKRTLEKGEITASILLPNNIQVDLMVQKPESYGSLLQHFTGSKHHNIALREHALKMGLSLSEYGIKEKGKLLKFSEEVGFYKKLGMDFIPPELREDSGEIEAALNHSLPELIELFDVKGDLQMHTNFDIETSHDIGESSMKEMVDMALSLGYEYIAFTDHNPSRSKHNDKEIISILKERLRLIGDINYSLKDSVKTGVYYVFNSLEIDILPSGELAIPESAFEYLDFALVSIHSSFDLNKDDMTNRVLKGLDHPKVKIFAHPTARKINVREGVELNWSLIFDFCLKNDKWIEINADPMRLDLPDALVREAVKKGVKLTLGTDAHSKEGLLNMPYGINVARRGWAKKSDIINNLSLKEFQKMLK